MNMPERLRLSDPYPHLGTGPVPVEPYISRAYYEREREKIFRRMWLNVGRLSQIPKPGDFIVKKLAVLGASVLVVHSDDGRVRAFYNVCQHRGNRLVYEESGCRKAFACGFHAWVYDSRGHLKHVTDEEQFFGIDKPQLNLPEFACDVWNGFIFINQQVHPLKSLREYLGQMGEDLRDYPFGTADRVGAWRLTVNCNWKVINDAFAEGYHVPWLHARSLADAFATGSGAEAKCLMTDARLRGYHRGASAPANPGSTPKPAAALAFRFAALLGSGSAVMRDLAPGLNPSHMKDWGFDFNAIFPNFTMVLQNGWYLTHAFWPEAVDRTHWEINFYSEHAATLASKVAQTYNNVMIRDLLQEDASTIEGTQEGLSSGGIQHLTFSDQEIACRHQFEVVEALVNGEEVGV